MPNVEHAGHHRVADLDGLGVAVDEFRLGLQGLVHGHDRHEVLLLADHGQTQEIQHRLQQGVQILDLHLALQFAVQLQGDRLVADLPRIVDVVQAHVFAHEIQQLDHA